MFGDTNLVKNAEKSAPSRRVTCDWEPITKNQSDMGKIIKGNRALALELGVHYNTVSRWKQEGILEKGILAEVRRVILWDLDMVKQALRENPYQVRRDMPLWPPMQQKKKKKWGSL